MAISMNALDHPKRRRRRGRPRQAIAGRLVLEDRLRGDVGFLSEDVRALLFAQQPFNPETNSESTESPDGIFYVGISPLSPLASTIEDNAWTIIPVRFDDKGKGQDAEPAPPTVRFPAKSKALQSFVHTLEQLDTSKNLASGRRTVEIRLINVAPLPLETIYVTVERDLLKNLDDVISKFGGGFLPDANGYGYKGKGRLPIKEPPKKTAKLSAKEKEERLRAAVRGALSSTYIVHSGDMLPLPLPAHPITYIPPPPAKVSFCEPVSQGLIVPRTKIILVQVKSAQAASRIQKPLMRQVLEDEAEDTSNEQFYSAAEERPLESSEETTTAADDSEPEDSVAEVSDGSDDSLDDMISLSAPGLPPEISAVQTLTNATPRPGGRRNDGIQTPGSVFSSFTATTAQQGKLGGKVFKAQPLLHRIPIEALHPQPSQDEDDESFVFVDINTLAKVGCFSGDWVRVETAADPTLGGLAALGLAGLRPTDESNDWRPVKVYGLTGLPSSKPRYAVHTNDSRRHSFSYSSQSTTPVVYTPPVLFHNLGGTKYLKISPLNPPPPPGLRHIPQQRPINSQKPPVAEKVTIVGIASPLSMDRNLRPVLFERLKQHFQSKRRLVKCGDLIGISIDEGLGRAVFSGRTNENSAEDDLSPIVAMHGCSADNQTIAKKDVGWFRVNTVSPMLSDDQESLDPEKWDGVAAVDIGTTRLAQQSLEYVSSVPPATENTWEFWFGVKNPPKSSHDAFLPQNLVTKPPYMFIPQLQRRLRELISAATSPRAIHLGMQPIAILLTSTQRGIGKATATRRAGIDLGFHTAEIDGYDILTDGGASGGDVSTEQTLRSRAERTMASGPEYTALLIRHIEVLNADRMVSAFVEIIAESRVVVATTTEVDKVPEGLRSLFTHEFEMMAPDEKEREGILRNAVIDRCVKLGPDVDLAAVAVKTAALVASDLVDVVERAQLAKSARLETLVQKAGDPIGLCDVQISGGEGARCVTKADFDIAVEAARKNFADAIGAPKIPNVTWDDVGGLTNVKDAVMETIQLPLERPELFAKGMKKRSGILFYGPPGTGKTLLAKAIATEFSLNFFSVKGPELLNMYIGESEANVRRVFQRARDARPCVVFFDELDSVAPKRGNQGDSGGVMDRIVSQLLAELDGMSSGEENGGGVFVIGATNRPDLLDPALLRPGRFDKMLYLGVSDTHEKQITILEALTRKFNLHPSISLPRIADRLPFTYTGADLYALCSDAMLKAITRQATAVDEKIRALPGGTVTTAYYFDHLATDDDVAVMVTEEDFIAAQAELVGSVSAKELEHFERVRNTFESSDTKSTTTNAQNQVQSEVPWTNQVEEMPPTKPKFASRSSGKGKGKGKAGYKSPSPFEADGEMGDQEDSDDDYVIKTDHLRVNGHGPDAGQTTSNGSVFTGKRKNVGGSQFEETTAEDDEEMYS